MEFEAALPVDGKALNAVAFEAAVAEDLPGLHAREDVLDAGADLLVGLAGHGCRVSWPLCRGTGGCGVWVRNALCSA